MVTAQDTCDADPRRNDGMNDPAVRELLDRLFTEVQAKSGSMRKSFKQIDSSKDGKLSREEVLDVLAELGLVRPLRDTELDAVLRAFDADRNGKIDYAEFCAAMTRRQRATALAAPSSAQPSAAAAAPSAPWDVEPPHEQVSARIRASARPITIRFRRGGCSGAAPARAAAAKAMGARVREWLRGGAAGRYVWWRDRLVFCVLMWCKFATFIMTCLSLQAIICERPEGGCP
jgi:hypothetical protein